MIDNVRSIGDETVNIAIVGKYIKLEDSYLSVIESLHHAGFANKVKVNIKLIDCESINPETAAEKLAGLQGIIVPELNKEKGSAKKLSVKIDPRAREIALRRMRDQGLER